MEYTDAKGRQWKNGVKVPVADIIFELSLAAAAFKLPKREFKRFQRKLGRTYLKRK